MGVHGTLIDFCNYTIPVYCYDQKICFCNASQNIDGF